MPELPEVETIRCHLAPVVDGRTFTAVHIVDERWSGSQSASWMEDQLCGQEVSELQRRGKYFVWRFASGMILLVHLRMTGTFLINPQQGSADKYQRVVLELDDQTKLVFCDPRRFGTGQIVSRAEFAVFDASLGVEPLSSDFTPEFLAEHIQGRKTPIKAFLLDQRHIAGIGNIYADEALFQAGILPTRMTKTLDAKETIALHGSIVSALQNGLAAKGASIDDFRHPDGVKGTFQHQFLVHRRGGRKCVNCQTTIDKIRVAGRGTYICRQCQL